MIVWKVIHFSRRASYAMVIWRFTYLIRAERFTRLLVFGGAIPLFC
jgi:hypothetical protein